MLYTSSFKPHLTSNPGSTVFIIAFLTWIQTGSSIECYECVHNSRRMKRKRRYVYPCSEFDGSETYKVDCPDSEFCVYQTITMKLAKDTITVQTMDGCTPNATDLHRLAETHLAVRGCTYISSVFSPSSVSHCYCSEDYCNKSLTIMPCIFCIICLIMLTRIM